MQKSFSRFDLGGSSKHVPAFVVETSLLPWASCEGRERGETAREGKDFSRPGNVSGQAGRLPAIRRCDFLTCPAGKKLVAACSIDVQVVRFPVGGGLTRMGSAARARPAILRFFGLAGRGVGACLTFLPPRT